MTNMTDKTSQCHQIDASVMRTWQTKRPGVRRRTDL